MKRLFLVRHAKSSWSNANLQDFDRPLNKRGIRDAPFMAKMMVGKGIKPDQIVTSPANRAITTAQQFAAAQGIEHGELDIRHEIYEAYPELLLQLVRGFSDKADTIFMFGHNPGFTYLANMFDGDYIVNIPTCGIVEINANIKQWQDLGGTNGKIVNFYYPKQYFS